MDASELSRDWTKSQSDDDKHLQVSIQPTRYQKLKFGTSAPTVLCGSLYILRSQRSLSRALAALLILYPLVVLVLGNGTGWRQALGSQAQRGPACLTTPCLHPILLRTPPRPGLHLPMLVPQQQAQAGLGLDRHSDHTRRGGKPSPLPRWAVFPEESLLLFSLSKRHSLREY